MAAELQLAHGTTGRTLYAVLRSATGTVYNTAGAAFEAYNASNWTSYDIALTEQGTSGYYVGDMPAVAAGIYAVEVRWQAGGSPATTDTTVGSGEVNWTGTVVAALSDVKTKTDQLTFTSANKVDSTLQAAADLATAVAQKVAHVVLRRTMSAVEAAADGDTLDLSSLYGLIQQAQESSASGATLTVKKTDGSTTLGTKTLATDASADPVVGVS